MKKGMMIVLAVLAVAVLAILVFSQGGNESSTNSDSENTNSLNENQLEENMAEDENEVEVIEEITLEVLSTHDLKTDCWVSYQGKVYDITSWLPRHPGSSEAIEPYCGTAEEFESAFTGQHGTYQVDKLIEEGVYKGDLI